MKIATSRTKRAALTVKTKVKSGSTMSDAAKHGLVCTFVTYNLDRGEYFLS